MRFLPALLPLFLASVIAVAQEPNWIWPAPTAANDEVRFFRKTFPLAAVPAEAALSVSCDNSGKVFVNGVDVGEARSWNQPLVTRIEKHLKAGENVLAVRGKNTDGTAGVVVRLELTSGTAKTLIVSDTNWQTSDKEVAGWEKPGFTASGWVKPISLGKLGMAPWGDVFAGKTATVASTSPGAPAAPRAPQASGQPGPATETITAPGFKTELLYAADKVEEGSWVAMTVDDKGRIIVSAQRSPSASWGGMMRFTLGPDGKVAKSEKLNMPTSVPLPAGQQKVEKPGKQIGEAMGLLWAFDSLYVNGDGPDGYALYRVTFKDDQPASAEKVFRGSGQEHGSHGLVLGPDNQIYFIHGNMSSLRAGDKILPTSKLKNWAEDDLLPRAPDPGGHANGTLTPGGFVVRSADQGKTWELFSGGFRNVYDLDFNMEGEFFTYDSDMEWDLNLPWYRPTRINHIVSGGDAGWRSASANNPPYYFDSLPAAVEIGIGSPTGVKFGTGAKGWPDKYRRAFYAMDWAYGKLYAVHPEPDGASYRGTFEVFVEGKPLNVSDLDFVNGTMYFTTGGRGSQSGLYRVTYTGPANTPMVPEDPKATAARALRRQLESFHGRQDPKALDVAWPHLDSPDRFIRWAARTAIEFQPLADWQARALAETRPWASLEAMLAVIRCANPMAKLQPQTDMKPLVAPAVRPEVATVLCEKIGKLPVERIEEAQQLAGIHLAWLTFTRLGPPTEEERQKLGALWLKIYPSKSENVNRELSKLLVFLDAPGAVPKTMALLRAATAQDSQIHYAFQLRNGRQYASPGVWKPDGPLSGWTPDLRREFFAWYAKAEREYKGGLSFKQFIVRAKKQAIELLSEQDKAVIADLLHPVQIVPAAAKTDGPPRGFVKAWTVDQAVAEIGSAKGDVKNGRKIYAEAQCALCHRYGEEGGSIGPDLTGVSSRFNRRDLFESIIDPNKVVSDQYQNTQITTTHKREHIGRVVDDQPDKIVLQENPFSEVRLPINKKDIAKSELSPWSPMPPGLINLFTKEELVDLVTFLETGGK